MKLKNKAVTIGLYRVAIILALAIASCLGTDVPAQSPEIVVETDRTQIFVGESLRYRVTLNHFEPSVEPELPKLDDFAVSFVGDRSLNSQRVTIINGKRTEEIRHGRQFDYRLTPNRDGNLTIPAPTATVDGKTIAGRPLTVRVVAAEPQDYVQLRLATDHSEVYPTQPFTITLTVSVQALPGEFGEVDPLSVQDSPPTLEIPWLMDDNLAAGLEPQQTYREILDPLVDRGRGFQINGFRSQSIFSLLEPESVRFRPAPIRSTHTDASGDEIETWDYLIERTFIPSKVGTLDFGPVTVKGIFATDIRESGRLDGKQIYAVAEPISITVKPVPRAGRPDSYLGAIGKIDVTTSLVPTEAQVGDPMTLTMTVRGQGSLADALPPDLEAIPEISSNYRIYEATEETMRDGKRFIYSLRPMNKELTEFPAITTAYFDVDEGEYVTASTPPIPVTIAAAEKLPSEAIVAGSEAPGARLSTLQTSDEGLFGNRSDLDEIHDDSVAPARWATAWIVMLVGFGLGSALIHRFQSTTLDPLAKRRRSAIPRARRRLEAAANGAVDATARSKCQARRDAVAGLIADFAGVPPAGLTPQDAVEQLERLGVGDELPQRAREFLERCDAARYSAVADPDVDRLDAEASGLVDELAVELRSNHKTISVAAWAIVCLSLAAGCARAVPSDVKQQFEQAERSFAGAVEPADFVQAASEYQSILDRGIVSGVVLYNQGNAWMRAGQVGRAIASYRRAKRYLPSDPYLDANLQLALTTAGTASHRDSNRLVKYVLFWQDWLDYRSKFVLGTLLMAATLMLGLAAQLNRPFATTARRLGIACGCLCFLALLSAGWDWYRFDLTTHGVVVTDELIARKGASERHDSAFTTPLPEGSEFTVIGQRAGWREIELPGTNDATGASRAWVPERDVVLY